jgi:hypothetical protein
MSGKAGLPTDPRVRFENFEALVHEPGLDIGIKILFVPDDDAPIFRSLNLRRSFAHRILFLS